MKSATARNIQNQAITGQLKANGYLKEEFFKDNLEHIEHLEYIARVRLATAFFRNSKYNFESTDNNNLVSTNDIKNYLTLGFTPIGLDKVPQELTLLNLVSLLKMLEKENANKVIGSIKNNIDLHFEGFCNSYNLDKNERDIAMLLLAIKTGERFRGLFDLCNFATNPGHDGGMSIGNILSLVFPDYRDQITNRKYFSIDARLMKHDIVAVWGYIDETTDILNEKVYLHERIVRYIIGDDHVYDIDMQCISKYKSPVKLDQVIIPDTIKKDLYELALNYSSKNNKNEKKLIREYYGYGTGLTFFFFGPSGTGKTMLAHAIANALDVELLTMNVERAMEMRSSFEDLLKNIFKEAKLCNGIVLFDECDIIFNGGTEESRSLLIEIEKAECITILATNSVVELDPALDRRITMKIPFLLPSESQRESIWEALVPPQITIG